MKSKCATLRDELFTLENNFTNACERAEAAYNKSEKKRAELQSICKHDKVVILWSSYKGSYSMDKDDAHKESRLCLRCELQETALEWDELHNPIRRFELYNQKAPWFIEDCLQHPLPTIMKHVLKEGYKVNTFENN